jgi:transcriptional regulator with XRE-family HTH domain
MRIHILAALLSRARRIAVRLKGFREARGFSQAALAKLSGLPQGYISGLERGRVTNPGVWTLHKLARVLGVTLDAFVA